MHTPLPEADVSPQPDPSGEPPSGKPTPWPERLRSICIPEEFAVLTLKTLGVADDIVKEIYGLSTAQFKERSCTGIACGQDTLPHMQKESPFDLAPIGIKHLESLIATPPLRFSRQSFAFSCQVTDSHNEDSRAIDVAGELARLEGKDHEPASTRNRPGSRINASPDFFLWCDSVRRIFLRELPSVDLLFLLPQSSTKKTVWHVLEHQELLRSQEHALRLLCGLSILGLSHDDSKHRLHILPDLVRITRSIRDWFGCRAVDRELEGPKAFGHQMIGLTDEQVFMRPDANLGHQKTARPLMLDFSAAWRKHSGQFADLAIHDRTQNADELVNALYWMMTQTSGICVHLRLHPYNPAQKRERHKVRVYAPLPWIEFLKKGNGTRGRREKEDRDTEADLLNPEAALLYTYGAIHPQHQKKTRAVMREDTKMVGKPRKHTYTDAQGEKGYATSTRLPRCDKD